MRQYILFLLALSLRWRRHFWRRHQAATPQLVPLPAQMTLAQGDFEVNAATVLVAQSPDAKKEAQFFAASIAPAMGFTLPVTTSATKLHAIQFVLDANAKTGAEGYHLNVTPQQITLLASSGAGLFYGGQTLRQLLPVEVFADSQASEYPTGKFRRLLFRMRRVSPGAV